MQRASCAVGFLTGLVCAEFVASLSLQIGTNGTFDAEDYRQSLAANVALQQQIKEKRHGSAAQEGGT